MSKTEVRLEYLWPKEIEDAKSDCPSIFLPIGTIEWHGLHNQVGLDSTKAHKICELAAQHGGGVVHPPHYGAVGGLDEPHTFIFDQEAQLESTYFKPWIEKWCAEAARNGYKAIIMLTGHYGSAQQMTVRSAALRMSQVLGIPVLGLPEYWLALDEQYYGDHAAFFETSLMMDLYPGSVKLDRLVGEPPYQGVGGRNPKTDASAEEGARFNKAIIARLAKLATDMPGWSSEQLERYIKAEQAILRKQMLLAAEKGDTWAGWRNIGNNVLDKYPEYLVNGDFDGIEALADKL